MHIPNPRGTLAAAVIALALVVTACGGDDSSDKASTDTEQTTVPPASTEPTKPGDPDTSVPTAEEICTKVSADVVSSSLGIEVTGAVPTDPLADVVPTCTYSYTGAKGKAGVVTVAALRPLDMGGRTGTEGYKSLVGSIETFFEGQDFETTPVEAGRQSVRFTGADAHATFSDTGRHVLQIVVPKADADPDEADALLAAVIGALG